MAGRSRVGLRAARPGARGGGILRVALCTRAWGGCCGAGYVGGQRRFQGRVPRCVPCRAGLRAALCVSSRSAVSCSRGLRSPLPPAAARWRGGGCMGACVSWRGVRSVQRFAGGGLHGGSRRRGFARRAASSAAQRVLTPHGGTLHRVFLHGDPQASFCMRGFAHLAAWAAGAGCTPAVPPSPAGNGDAETGAAQPGVCWQSRSGASSACAAAAERAELTAASSAALGALLRVPMLPLRRSRLLASGSPALRSKSPKSHN